MTAFLRNFTAKVVLLGDRNSGEWCRQGVSSLVAMGDCIGWASHPHTAGPQLLEPADGVTAARPRLLGCREELPAAPIHHA